jgi:hypothetical protein
VKRLKKSQGQGMNLEMKENYFSKNHKPFKAEASTMDNLIRAILSQREAEEKEGKE